MATISSRAVPWLLLPGLLAAGCAQSGAAGADAGARTMSVTAVAAVAKDVPIYLDGLGAVTAYYTVTVKSQVDGRLDEVRFQEGQQVKKGDLLAQIDPRPFLAQLHQAEGALARDRAQLDAAKLDLVRYAKLVDQKLIPSQQFDQQKALVGQAEGASRVDEAAVETAKLNISYAHITAPIDGVTGIRQVDPGNLVHASDPTGMVILTQLDPIAVIFTLPEDDLPRVAEAMRAGQLPVEAFSRTGETHLGTGQLALIDNQINQATATIRLKAILQNPDRLLWPNQFVKARLLVATHKDAIVIPTPAVQRGPQGTFVYVVGSDETAAVRAIEVDVTADDVVLVKKGIKAGEQVVIEGQNMLRPGAKVQAHPPAPSGGGAGIKGRP